MGKIQQFAGGELRVGGDMSANLGVLVDGKSGEQMRRCAGVGREKREDLGILGGLGEGLEQMARRKRIGGDELLGDGGLGQRCKFLEQAGGERRFAQGDGGLAHAVAPDAFEESGGGKGGVGQDF